MKRIMLKIWKTFDPIYFWFTRLCYVVDDDQVKTFFRVRVMKYRGPVIRLVDGTVVRRNDLLIKIHLHNARLLSDLQTIHHDVKKAIYIARSIKKALPHLAKLMDCQYEQNKIKGIVGITNLSQGAQRLGFEIIPINSKYYRFLKQCTFLFIRIVATSYPKTDPVYLFMSKNKLMTNYLPSKELGKRLDER